MVLPPETAIRELYRLAAEQEAQIRHLDYKKDSLQDIFLKAMENGQTPDPARSGTAATEPMESRHGGL